MVPTWESVIEAAWDADEPEKIKALVDLAREIRLAGRAARVEQVKGNRAKGKQPRASRPSDDIP
jgi:hypothetical protein